MEFVLQLALPGVALVMFGIAILPAATHFELMTPLDGTAASCKFRGFAIHTGVMEGPNKFQSLPPSRVFALLPV